MATMPRVSIAAILMAGLIGAPNLWADSVRLTNGDTLVGKVMSLDAKQLVLNSENFGEMKIPRDKVEIIGLGEVSLAPPPAAAGTPSAPGASGELPSLQNPQVQQQVDQLLQQALGGEMGNMRQQMQSTREGLKELQEDLGPGSSADALDGYIKLFEMFGGPAPAEPSSPPQQQ